MSTENRLFRAYGQGCARGTLIYSLVAVIIIGGFCCLSTMVLMLPLDDGIRPFVWVGVIVTFIFLAVGVTVVGAVVVVRKRARDLDEIFLPLGLEGRGYLTNGRQYHGTYHGYPLHVYFHRGPTLQIYLDVPLGTRVGIGRQSELARLASTMLPKELLDIDDPAFEHLAIYPDDHQWTTNLFADSQIRDTILRLTNEEAATEVRSLSITPNAILWQTRYIPLRNIKTEAVRAWINDLYEMARTAQGLTPPTVSAVESGLERTTRTDRGKYTGPIIGITCGIVAAMAGCIIAISVIIIILAESGY